MPILNRSQLTNENNTVITDPLNKQITAAGVRGLMQDVIDSSFNLLDGTLAESLQQVLANGNNTGTFSIIVASGSNISNTSGGFISFSDPIDNQVSLGFTSSNINSIITLDQASGAIMLDASKLGTNDTSYVDITLSMVKAVAGTNSMILNQSDFDMLVKNNITMTASSHILLHAGAYTMVTANNTTGTTQLLITPTQVSAEVDTNSDGTSATMTVQNGSAYFDRLDGLTGDDTSIFLQKTGASLNYDHDDGNTGNHTDISVGNGTVSVTGPTGFKGIQYGANYGANFVAKSLIDLEYLQANYLHTGSASSIVVATPLYLNGSTISIYQSTSTQSGYLSTTDWNTFNNKASTASIIGVYALLSGATFSGQVSTGTYSIITKTQLSTDNSTYVATTQFVQNVITNYNSPMVKLFASYQFI
jgi:hypothetical protein